MKTPVLIAVLFSAFALATLAPATQVPTLLFDPVDEKRDRTVPLKVYFIPSDDPQPVILFSHGLGGSREANPYLGNHWAEHGYVAVFIQHHGSDRGVWEDAPPAERLSTLKNAAGLQATLDRFEDIPFVIDQLEQWNKQEDHPLSGKLDLDHVGLAGHSYGAVTTLGLSGRTFPLNRSFGDNRIDAFLPMSPQPGKGLAPDKAFGHLGVPLLCMTGTEDGSPIDPTLKPETRREVYAALPPGDKYQLVFEGAHHFAFGDSRGGLRQRDRNSNHHPAILEISTRFWNAYLKGNPKDKSWLQSDAPHDEGHLASMDVWEWK